MFPLDRAEPCRWSQSLAPTAELITTAAKKNIKGAAASCPARPTTSGPTVTWTKAGSLEERQGTPRRDGARFTRPLHTATPTVSSREPRARRRAGSFLLLPLALTLFFLRTPGSWPSTSTKTSTSALNSRTAFNPSSRRRHWDRYSNILTACDRHHNFHVEPLTLWIARVRSSWSRQELVLLGSLHT